MLGDKKRWQFWPLSGKLAHMSGGRFLLILTITAWAGGLTWSQEAPPVRSNTSTNAPTISTNAATTSTNRLPQVVGPELKSVEVVPEKPKDEDALAADRQEAKIKALKEFGVIVRKDPFRLKQPPKVEKRPEIPDFVPVRVPQLQGISTLYNPPKAVLRMSKTGGGKAESVFLAPGERNLEVEVISIDVATSTVVVKVGAVTYDLGENLKKATFASKPTSGSGSLFSRGSTGSRSSGSTGSRSSGSTGSRSSGSTGSRSSGSTGSRSSGSTGSRPITPPRKPGGLKPVPTRPDASFRATPPQYEMPAFNEAVQKLAVEPSQISTQREMIHGQFNYTVPTDFPEKLR
jgi:hypothetical protein